MRIMMVMMILLIAMMTSAIVDDNSIDYDDVHEKGNNIVINHKYDHHNHPHSA